jgi:hypothetical protein
MQPAREVMLMYGRRSYKSDESFLEKISIGAIGTRKVFADLSDQGHNPIELERGSMNFKIWKGIKIKRVRVPDLLCVNCGKRVESRGKTKLEITMSHSSSTPERGWDSGLNDDDYLALVKCSKTGLDPADWTAENPVQYISISTMRAAFQKKLTISEKPKGAAEGFELRVTWPSCLANEEGEIISVNPDKIQYRRIRDNRVVTLQLHKRGIPLFPQVGLNEKVEKNQIISSVVPVIRRFECSKTAGSQYYIDMLKSASLSERYVAAKALTGFSTETSTNALIKTLRNDREHIYVRLEAAASLFKTGHVEYLSFFQGLLNDQYLENRLECVIVLGEIGSPESCNLLIKTLLDQNQHPEIRAGAAWSLGELRNRNAMEALVTAFDASENNVREEAARALMRFVDKYSTEIVRRIPSSTENQRAGIAWALSKSGGFKVQDLMSSMVDDDSRKWAAWIIGTQNEATYISELEDLKRKDKEVYFAVTVLWKVLSSWIEVLEVY